MKNLILFIIIALTLLLFGKCSHSIYVGIRDFPEYASVEVMSEKYQKLIDEIDGSIEAGSSVLSIGANLEAINYPSETVYVAMNPLDSNDDDIIIKGREASSRNITIKSGFGYGTLGNLDVVIISRPIKKAGLENVLVYIKYLNPNKGNQ